MGSQQEPPPFRWHYADLDDTTTTSAYQLRGRTLFFVVILFAIILLASLLFFYARWVCHSRHFPYSPSRNRDLAAQVGRRRRELDAAVISALPVLLYGSMVMMSSSSDANGKKSESEEGGECCICLSLFEEDDKIKVLPDCNHCFHSECVDRWLLTQSTCPLCRSALRFHQSAAADTRIVIH